MATVPGPPVQLAAVRAVFGAPAGTPLNQFYRGGPYVPNIPQNNNVPTAPPIRLSSLAGATNYTAVTASITPNSITVTAAGPGTVTANASGGTGSYTYNWQYVAGDTTHIGLTSGQGTPNATFHVSNPVKGQTYNATWHCVVSDGTTSATPTVAVAGTLV